MVRMSVKTIAASLVVLGTLGAPTIGSAQGPLSGLRSPVGGSPVRTGTARGDGAAAHLPRLAGGRPLHRITTHRPRPVPPVGLRASWIRHLSARVAALASSHERGPRRSKTKSALMIAGGAATGAGVGGALKGKKGALIGAAIGGGGASIYEAAKRR